MAINDTQKTDFLWKRIIFGTTETDITGKGGPNETVPSPVPTYIQNIWGEGNLVPVPAAALANVVEEYGTATALQCTADPTVEVTIPGLLHLFRVILQPERRTG